MAVPIERPCQCCAYPTTDGYLCQWCFETLGLGSILGWFVSDQVGGCEHTQHEGLCTDCVAIVETAERLALMWEHRRTHESAVA